MISEYLPWGRNVRPVEIIGGWVLLAVFLEYFVETSGQAMLAWCLLVLLIGAIKISENNDRLTA